MKNTKYNLVLSLSAVAVATIMAKDITVTNISNEPLCVAFVKTDAPNIKGRVMGDTARYTKLAKLGDNIQYKETTLVPGETFRFKAYPRDISKYDRTLWIIPHSSTDDNCSGFANMQAGDTKPSGAIPLEVGNKDRMFIVSVSGGKFALKSWTKQLEQQAVMLKGAVNKALKNSGMSWEEFKNSTKDSWARIKASFANAYNDAKRGAAKARRKVFGKSKAEIAGEVEGEGEEGGGEQPGRPMEGAGREGEVYGFAAHGEEWGDQPGVR
jgi:hypothetical protein